MVCKNYLNLFYVILPWLWIATRTVDNAKRDMTWYTDKTVNATLLHGSSTNSQVGCPCMPYTVGSSVWGWGFKGRWCSKSRKGFLDAWRNVVLKATSGNRSPAPLSMQIRKLDPECWPLLSESSFGPVCRSRIKIMLFEFWAVKLQSGCDGVVPSVTYSGWMWHRCQLDLNPPMVPWRASSMLGLVDYAGLGLL